jgi:hypothetical protein
MVSFMGDGELIVCEPSAGRFNRDFGSGVVLFVLRDGHVALDMFNITLELEY